MLGVRFGNNTMHSYNERRMNTASQQQVKLVDLNLQNEIAQQQPDFQMAAHLKPSYQAGWSKTDKI